MVIDGSSTTVKDGYREVISISGWILFGVYEGSLATEICVVGGPRQRSVSMTSQGASEVTICFLFFHFPFFPSRAKFASINLNGCESLINLHTTHLGPINFQLNQRNKASLISLLLQVYPIHLNHTYP